MWQTFKECGWPSYLVVFFAIFASLVSVVAGVLSISKVGVAKMVSAGAIVFALSPVLVGVVGMITSKHKVDAVLASPGLNPAMVARVREVGYSEANGCVSVGMGGMVLPLVVACAALLIAVVAPKKPA